MAAERALAHYVPNDELVNIACTAVREGYAERQRVLRMWHEDRPEATIEYQIIRTHLLGHDGAAVSARGRHPGGETP